MNKELTVLLNETFFRPVKKVPGAGPTSCSCNFEGALPSFVPVFVFFWPEHEPRSRARSLTLTMGLFQRSVRLDIAPALR